VMNTIKSKKLMSKKCLLKLKRKIINKKLNGV
jgi:hypothetical protein